MRRLLSVVCVGLAWGLLLAPPAMAQQGPDLPDDAYALSAHVIKLYGEGKYAEAIPLAQRALVIIDKALGPDHPDVATALNNLAALYESHGRYADAEPLYKRALAIREKALGPDHPQVGSSLNNLALLYDSQGRYADAEPLYKRALGIREKALGPDHPDVGQSLNNLALLYESQGRYADAEPLSKRALAIREKALGPDHPDVGGSLNNLAALYDSQGRYADAEPLYKRALAIREKALGPDHPDVGTSLNNLALLYEGQGRYAEAEPLFKRALGIIEKALGPEHPDVGTSLNNLAGLYWSQGRYAEAEPLFKRSLAIGEKALGPEHPSVGNSLNNLALLYKSQGRYADAEPLYKRSLAISEKALGPDHPNVGRSLNDLAALYVSQGRYAEAEPLSKRSLAIDEKALGPEHPRVATSLNNLAALYESQGRYAKAIPLAQRALAIREKALGPDHPSVGTFLSNLAAVTFVQRDWARAADFWRRSTGVVIRRAERGTEAVGQALTGKGKSEAEQSSWQFWGLVKAVHRVAAAERGPDPGLAAEMFQTAQWAQSSEAAQSLAQMAARGASGDAKLAAIVRERQDLVSEWQAKDKVQMSAVSQPPEKRNKEVERSNVARLSAIDARIADIDTQLAKDFPDYAALASPKPLTIADTENQIGEREALVLFLDTPEEKPLPEETFIWVVTKRDSRWVKSDLGSKALGERVAALRCGLDSSNWTDASGWSDATEDAKQRKHAQIARRDRCKTLTGADVTDRAPPPFDVAKAHDLYKALFGDIEDLIKDKRLLIVPSGALTQIPFQVLVTGKPDLAEETQPTGLTFGSGLSKLLGPPKYNKEAQVAEASNSAGETPTPWLIRRHAITVLPSVASLKALRQNAKTSKAARPFVGFGNPLLTGSDGKNKSAWAKQSCPKDAPKPDPVVIAGWTLPESFASLFRGGVADVAALRRQAPLPETADELCAVARELGAGEGDVNLGARATETRIKQLNAEGALAQARVVHFATHGLIASETESIAKSLAEPALLLTPPDAATATDDGLLTASEVTELKLNADWVVLSACNTAAGGEKGDAEALSGLARAFFYAGAHALLVSHWYVDSRAAVKITTGAFAELKRDPAIGRAEALRRAMLAAMTDTSRPKTWTPAAHPSVWAPFVLVGEGGAGR